jgi:phage terminase large subunit-like protein
VGKVTESFPAFCSRIGLALEPFQKRIARAALTEPELLVLLPRGQGKTTLMAAIAVHHLVTTPSPAVYVAAASRDQARILYEIARDFAEVLDELTIRHLELRVAGGHLRVLAADAGRIQGLTPSLAIVDELHAHRDDGVHQALLTSMAKRPGARIIVISTAGSGPDTPLGRLRARALAQADVRTKGAFTDARGALRMLEWAVPEDADTSDLAVVKKANPASWVTRDALARQREAVSPIAFARFHCNQWVGDERSWLPPGAWGECVGEPVVEDGERIRVGVDVGGERAASAVVWVNEAGHVGCAIFHGDEGVLECVAQVAELAERYRLVEVAFDPWRFGQGALELQQRGIPVVAFPQHDARMLPASDRLYRAIVERRLTLPDDAELRAHAGAAIAKHSRRGWRIDKANRSDQVDAVVALAMAVDAKEQAPEPVRVLGWI